MAQNNGKGWPSEKVVLRKLDTVRPNDVNPRTHTLAQIEQVAASIRQWGWTFPILIDDTGMIIAGHCRLEAAKLLDLAHVPAMIAKGWTAEQKRAYVIADNKLALNAGWDIKLLAGEIDDLTLADFDINLLGFSPDDLARMQTDLDRLMLGEISEGASGKGGDPKQAHPLPDGAVEFSLVMATDARRAVQAAITVMKERRGYETSAEALVGICNEWLGTNGA
jgi:ParB-like chromosome segregation protein Spo0J